MADVNREQIEKTLHRRDKFLDELEKDTTIFIDPKMGSLYLKALADTDKQAQTNLRLEVEDKQADSAAEQAQAMSAISESIQRNGSNPFLRGNAVEADKTPVIKQSGKFEILETELNEKASGQTYDQFTTRQKSEEAKRLALKK